MLSFFTLDEICTTRFLKVRLYQAYKQRGDTGVKVTVTDMGAVVHYHDFFAVQKTKLNFAEVDPHSLDMLGKQFFRNAQQQPATSDIKLDPRKMKLGADNLKTILEGPASMCSIHREWYANGEIYKAAGLTDTQKLALLSDQEPWTPELRVRYRRVSLFKFFDTNML